MPPEITDEVEDMDTGSSTVAEDVLADAAAPAADADPAKSSSATDETEANTLSVVRDVVGQRAEQQAEAAPSAEGEEVAGDVAGGQAKEQDDYSDVPFHKHPRFQEVVAEKNAFKADSTEYRKITSFLDDNGLSPTEAAEGLEVMALMKMGDPKAWELLRPRVQNLLIAIGEVLPDDLAKQVTDKVLTREAALEVSKARASLKTQEVRQKFNEQRGQRQQQRQAGEQLTTAAATWEKDRQLKDPNFNAKLPRIQEKLAFLHNVKRERPTDAAGVTAQLKSVYAEVNKEFKPPVVAAAPVNGARPVTPIRKPAITPIRGGQVASSAQAPTAPKNTREVLDAVVARRRA
jgi:hypothetical protein